MTIADKYPMYFSRMSTTIYAIFLVSKFVLLLIILFKIFFKPLANLYSKSVISFSIVIMFTLNMCSSPIIESWILNDVVYLIYLLFYLWDCSYTINRRTSKHGCCQLTNKSYMSTHKSVSTCLDNKMHSWSRQTRSNVFYRLFKLGDDGVFPNKVVSFNYVLWGDLGRYG